MSRKPTAIRRWRYRVNPARLVALVLFIAVLAMPGVFYAQSAPGVRPPVQEVVTVQPGDTLWGIAARYTEPGGDVRPVVERLRTYNELDSLILHPGQTIEIPTP